MRLHINVLKETALEMVALPRLAPLTIAQTVKPLAQDHLATELTVLKLSAQQVAQTQLARLQATAQ